MRDNCRVPGTVPCTVPCLRSLYFLIQELQRKSIEEVIIIVIIYLDMTWFIGSIL